jgi:hypothetical protein
MVPAFLKLTKHHRPRTIFTAAQSDEVVTKNDTGPGLIGISHIRSAVF